MRKPTAPDDVSVPAACRTVIRRRGLSAGQLAITMAAVDTATSVASRSGVEARPNTIGISYTLFETGRVDPDATAATVPRSAAVW